MLDSRKTYEGSSTNDRNAPKVRAHGTDRECFSASQGNKSCHEHDDT